MNRKTNNTTPFLYNFANEPRKIGFEIEYVGLSIDKLGENLKITATEENRLIQAFEDLTRVFYLGLQFHPEFLIYKMVFLRIFKVFIKTSRQGI
ncbi:Uncharacterised protein (plasmid) [Legionella adelaidensis]|uniref:Glutamine amidotransferase domain-containing protein n=1 Tax=Legionella adelaidensis TaxID=45056 RepID=A0A0W0R1M9_9GAMM|nr:gamma-glutamyl-gamma-aminobutyrate hydrolase family protein [Legionella adelaidensis]KTC64988.1 hypothetical protein Lade_1668 [Legionella adelaidensis]VEH85332.1 Uncharacterised protein [Legionella adelaidensis]